MLHTLNRNAIMHVPILCVLKDCFIGFGGNVIRKQVKEKAKWYITHFDELLKELEER